jgi:hypothetical protein
MIYLLSEGMQRFHNKDTCPLLRTPHAYGLRSYIHWLLQVVFEGGHLGMERMPFPPISTIIIYVGEMRPLIG